MSTAMDKLSSFFTSKLKVKNLAKFHFEYIGKTCYYIQLNKFNEKPYLGLCKATSEVENQEQSIKHINMPAEVYADFVKALKRMAAVFPLDEEGMIISLLSSIYFCSFFPFLFRYFILHYSAFEFLSFTFIIIIKVQHFQMRGLKRRAL